MGEAGLEEPSTERVEPFEIARKATSARPGIRLTYGAPPHHGPLFQEPPPRALTQHRVTKWLMVIFGGIIILHYASTLLVFCFVEGEAAQSAATDMLSSIFGAAVPAETGLVVAATAFYFSRSHDTGTD